MIHLVATYGHLKDIKNARKTMQRLNKIRALKGSRPAYIQRIVRRSPYKHQSSRLHLVAGLHKAGMKYGVRHLAED
jgi:hypothetical protein